MALLRSIRFQPSRRLLVGLLLVATAGASAAVLTSGRGSDDDVLFATARLGRLSPRLVLAGTLRPAESLTYRSPLGGREAEITFLVPEGTRVGEGDLLARVDSTELERDLERASQDLRQVTVDLQVAEIDREQARATLQSLVEGAGAVGLDEARAQVQFAEKKLERLREAHDSLAPLLEKGFITREELKKTRDELEQAEEELGLSQRRSDVLIKQTHPDDRRRAELLIAQKDSQLLNVRARRAEAEAAVLRLRQQLEGSSLHAQRAGLVVYEEFLGASPRRKIRVGDRVTTSHGIVTIPEVDRMLVEAAVSEADVHRITPGQSATIRLEAYPDEVLSGSVVRVGTMARSSPDGPLDQKRFDVIVAIAESTIELRPEMTARVDVALGERASVVLIPVNAVFDRGGETAVYVSGSSQAEARPVQLGDGTETDVEVVSGLAAGERVALVPGGAGATPEQRKTQRPAAATAPAASGRLGEKFR